MVRERRVRRNNRKNLRVFDGKRRIRVGGGLEFSFELGINAIYIFVDDDKGKPQHKDKVVGMMARSFDGIQNAQFLYLLRLLHSLKAYDWHSRKDSGLQHVDKFQEVLKAVDRCKSRLFIWRQPQENLTSEEARRVAFGNGGIFEGLEHFWPEDDWQARLLLITIISILGEISSAPWTIKKPEAVVFFVDNMNFFDDKIGKGLSKGSESGIFSVFEGMHKDGYEIYVKSFKDKEKIPAWIKMLLGLVDGESWCYGRLMREDSQNETCMDLQGVHWNKIQNTGAAEEFTFKLEVVDEAIAETRARGGNYEKLAPKLQFYWDAWRHWLNKKRLSLNGGIADDEANKLVKYYLKQW